MGYTTEFYGGFTFDNPVSEELKNYINKFSEIRHMKRDVEKIKEMYPNWRELCFNGDLGNDGVYFIGGGTWDNIPGTKTLDESIVNGNYPGGGCPGLWCQWIVYEDMLMWDGGEKFYEYEEWLKYLIDNFIEPSGYLLNGEVEWRGEDSDDIGTIVVVNNRIEMKYGVLTSNIPSMSTEDLIEELKRRGYTVQN